MSMSPKKHVCTEPDSPCARCESNRASLEWYHRESPLRVRVNLIRDMRYCTKCDKAAMNGRESRYRKYGKHYLCPACAKIRPYFAEPFSGTALIYLTKGAVAIVDLEHAAYLAQWNWCVSAQGYAVRREGEEILFLHKVIAERAGMQIVGLEVDHKNGVPLDDRVDNLRPATHAQNMCNRRKSRNCASPFKGTHYDERRQAWVARIKSAGVQHHLGQFDTPEEAHAAYCAAAAKHHGAFARANHL